MVMDFATTWVTPPMGIEAICRFLVPMQRGNVQELNKECGLGSHLMRLASTGARKTYEIGDIRNRFGQMTV